MQSVTDGIVIHLQKHSDKMSMLQLFTREHGKVVCSVYGTRKYNNILQPLSVIEAELNIKSQSGICQLRSASLAIPAQNIACDIRRHSIAVFIAEILSRTLKHPMTDEALFDYLISIVKDLNNTDSPENLHLRFLLCFTDFLGITPEWTSGCWLDMQTGEMRETQPAHKDCFSPEETEIICLLLTNEKTRIERRMRQNLLRKLCQYYSLHLTDFQVPKSLEILIEIFDD